METLLVIAFVALIAAAFLVSKKWPRLTYIIGGILFSLGILALLALFSGFVVGIHPWTFGWVALVLLLLGASALIGGFLSTLCQKCRRVG